MEKTKTSTSRKKKKGSADTSQDLVSAYITYLLTNGHQPASVYMFCVDLGIQEEEFYSHFGSFDALEKFIWKGFLEQTINSLKADSSYENFNAREKLLAFYFTFVQLLNGNRSFVLLQLQEFKKATFAPVMLKQVKPIFDEFINGVLNEGKTAGEIATRPYLDKRYPDLFWVHFTFLILYWKNDDSKGFENTDAFIEKSINLAFDLIGKGAFDTAIDLAKFLYQSNLK